MSARSTSVEDSARILHIPLRNLLEGLTGLASVFLLSLEEQAPLVRHVLLKAGFFATAGGRVIVGHVLG